MIEVDVMKRLVKAEQENNALKNQLANQQATMDYIAMMSDIDISAGENESDDITNGGEA